MTGQQDIERTLDAWFVDGPSIMPDRLFNAVLDQVERTPQHPLSRLRLRLTEMNPRIRWLTAAAATLLAVVVAVSLINRPINDVGAPASPAASQAATESASAVPAELQAIWMTSTRSAPGVSTTAGVSIDLGGVTSQVFTLTDLGTDYNQVSRVEAVDSDTIRFTTATGLTGCDEGQTGTYTWSMSASAETLELAAEEPDTCPSRAAILPGTWLRADCPTDNDDCLGTLDAGTYATQWFDPFVGVDENWRRRYGALTFTVPDGWVNIEDWPGYFKLGPAGARDGTFIILASDVVVADTSGNCIESPDPDVGTDAAAITDWLATAEGLVASPAEPVTVGGLAGFRIDITIDPDWTEGCPWTDGQPVRHLFTDRETDPGFDWFIAPDEPMRLYFVDVAEDRALMIDIESLDPADYEAFVDEATTIVESFEFAP